LGKNSAPACAGAGWFATRSEVRRDGGDARMTVVRSNRQGRVVQPAAAGRGGLTAWTRGPPHRRNRCRAAVCTDMDKNILSRDGTPLAYESAGRGPAVVL